MPAEVMYDGSNTTILFSELAYQDVLPVAWHPLTSAADNERIAGFTDNNIRVLQACAALEEHSAGEKPDENSPHSADLQRLDFKVNLLLDLVGKILAVNHPRPAATLIRFNSMGTTFNTVAPFPKMGTRGFVEIYLHNALAEPLRLAGQVVKAESNGELHVQFDTVGDAVADLIEKLAFRLHRRRVAGSRQTRRS
jgi:hypothetical protein